MQQYRQNGNHLLPHGYGTSPIRERRRLVSIIPRQVCLTQFPAARRGVPTRQRGRKMIFQAHGNVGDRAIERKARVCSGSSISRRVSVNGSVSLDTCRSRGIKEDATADTTGFEASSLFHSAPSQTSECQRLSGGGGVEKERSTREGTSLHQGWGFRQGTPSLFAQQTLGVIHRGWSNLNLFLIHCTHSRPMAPRLLASILDSPRYKERRYTAGSPRELCSCSLFSGAYRGNTLGSVADVHLSKTSKRRCCLGRIDSRRAFALTGKLTRIVKVS